MNKSEIAERAARLFHETYERLAPNFGYETRKESAVPWESVPDKNKQLMIAVCAEVLGAIAESRGQADKPIPMVIYCPACQTVHIDEGEWATRPHKTHQCQKCKLEWRPYPYATVGVGDGEPSSAPPDIEELWNHWSQFRACSLGEMRVAKDFARYAFGRSGAAQEVSPRPEPAK
jgi:hypothetical protein